MVDNGIKHTLINMMRTMKTGTQSLPWKAMTEAKKRNTPILRGTETEAIKAIKPDLLSFLQQIDKEETSIHTSTWEARPAEDRKQTKRHMVSQKQQLCCSKSWNSLPVHLSPNLAQICPAGTTAHQKAIFATKCHEVDLEWPRPGGMESVTVMKKPILGTGLAVTQGPINSQEHTVQKSFLPLRLPFITKRRQEGSQATGKKNGKSHLIRASPEDAPNVLLPITHRTMNVSGAA
eukprot:CAMPEP_0113869356 /NCGR_PEP_ID=MMETSP0780_2-20120614/1490_1 /TAXON_ID=652834 /ORGANISM="Palpitomonas bilix" /LENGTH=233 /DNA_ID=CAMNT_0000854523 /DNA_START=322 /DNA_END=1023 /DNA_ORIENTATION=+ /assembly_acc=CAM_ASM_000599